MIAFLQTSAVCIQQTYNYARSHKNSLCFSQYCVAAVVFHKMYLAKKKKIGLSAVHKSHTYTWEMLCVVHPWVDALEQLGVEDLAQGHLISSWGQEIIRSLPTPREVQSGDLLLTILLH